MMVSTKHKIAFLALPKTGSTSIEAALLPHCDLIARRKPSLKHIGAARFSRLVKPLLNATGCHEIETTCLFRDPIDWLGSWYRYRSRAEISGQPRSTANLSFSEFAEIYMQAPRKGIHGVGIPSKFVEAPDKTIGINHIFRYDCMDVYQTFLSNIFGGQLMFKTLNKSPNIKLDITKDLRSRLEQFFAHDYEIYESVARSR